MAWADVQNRFDHAAVLACCGELGMIERRCRRNSTMGVDTSKQLHVVVSRWQEDNRDRREVIYIGTRQSYAELDELMERYNVDTCVIDALPEIHATRDFANPFGGRVFLNYFQESQRGGYRWDNKERLVYENRTEALDASRQPYAIARSYCPGAVR